MIWEFGSFNLRIWRFVFGIWEVRGLGVDVLIWVGGLGVFFVTTIGMNITEWLLCFSPPFQHKLFKSIGPFCSSSL